MTGFGEAAGAVDGGELHIEARSVNQRGRDVRVQTQPRMLQWEHEIARVVAQTVERGKVDVRLTFVAPPPDAGGGGDAELHRLRGERRRLRLLFGTVPPLGEPARRGGGDAGAVPLATVLDVAGRALAALDRSRATEGAALWAVLDSQLATIAAQAAALRGRSGDDAALRETALGERLRELGARGLGGVDVERMRAEVALLLVRDDVTEELDRLDAHIAAARALLAVGGPVGRRLDVLAQELGREAHTASAKTASSAGKAIALDLRHTVEQLREQVQNIE